MKRTIALLLCLCTLFSLLACTAELPATETEKATATEGTKEETKKPAKKDYPAVTDKLSWDKIRAIPVADSSMTVDELRKIVLQYFELAQTFAWTPDAAYQYVITTSDKAVTLPVNKLYGGMPYVTNGLGNLYRLMDFYDPETGIMKVSEIKSPLHWGNQCSYGCFWAWSRVSNTLTYKFTRDMTLANGSIPIGPYRYDPATERFSAENPTTKVCEANGEQIMYQSYAKLQPADGLVYYVRTGEDSGAGHVIMCTTLPVITYNEDGTINGEESYITYMDQAAKWHPMNQSDGTEYSVQGGVHAKAKFSSLFKGSYLPFTIAEFMGTDPVEKAEASLSIGKVDKVNADSLKNSVLNANYTISHVIVEITSPNGENLYSYTTYMGQGSDEVSTYEFPLSKTVFPASINKHADGKNKITVRAWVGTGECLEVCNAVLEK